jgi:hypothetical protein
VSTTYDPGFGKEKIFDGIVGGSNMWASAFALSRYKISWWFFRGPVFPC